MGGWEGGREGGRERGREGGRQRDRQRQREGERERERETSCPSDLTNSSCSSINARWEGLDDELPPQTQPQSHTRIIPNGQPPFRTPNSSEQWALVNSDLAKNLVHAVICAPFPEVKNALLCGGMYKVGLVCGGVRTLGGGIGRGRSSAMKGT